VRAGGGVKMSKTKGNVIDPLEVVDQVGGDALRFALTVGTSPGQDQQLTEAKLEGARNFTNKLWNAARFVLGARPEPLADSSGEPGLAERWIASRLAEVTERATHQLDALEMASYAALVHEAAWSDYCDWFIEMAKVELRRADLTDGDRARVWRAAASGLGTLQRLLHPIMPFVTEAIWERLALAAPDETSAEPLLISARWPDAGPRDADAEREFAQLADLVRAVRNLRTEAGVAAAAWIPLHVAPADREAAATLGRERAAIEALTRARPLTLHDVGSGPAPATSMASVSIGAAWIEEAPPTPATSDTRTRRELEATVGRLRTLLSSEFAARAPAAVVERERERLRDAEGQLARLVAAAGDPTDR